MTDQAIIKHLNSISDLLVALQTLTGEKIKIELYDPAYEPHRYCVAYQGQFAFGPTPAAAFEAAKLKAASAAAEIEVRNRHALALEADLAALRSRNTSAKQ
jgi:hypothetical protein